MPAWRWKLVYRKADACFDRIAFVSAHIRDQALQLRPAFARKGTVLPNPIVFPPAAGAVERAAARRSLGLDVDAKVIGNAGWLIPRKRFDVLLRVAARVQRRQPVTVLIAGDGPERPALEAQAASLGLDVRWLGWQSDLLAFFRSLDVLVFNSDADAHGNTPVEALAAGVPAVCSVLEGGLPAFFAEHAPALVCIGALPPGGLAHTRYLCKKLRARFPEIKIVVGRWGLTGGVEANREQLQDAGADLTATTMLETQSQLNSLLPILTQQQGKSRAG